MGKEILEKVILVESLINHCTFGVQCGMHNVHLDQPSISSRSHAPNRRTPLRQAIIHGSYNLYTCCKCSIHCDEAHLQCMALEVDGLPSNSIHNKEKEGPSNIYYESMTRLHNSCLECSLSEHEC